MRRWGVGVVLALALAGVVGLNACATVIGAEFDDARSVECKHAAPPPRPTVSNAGGEEEVLVAITSVEVGDELAPSGAAGFREIGFDLDGVCANLGERPPCRTFDWAKGDPTDGVDGIDNAGGALMAAELEVFNISPFTSATVTKGIGEGKVAPLALLRIRKYNLRVVDDLVELDWYVAEPLGKKPTLDGTDAWPMWEGTLASTPTAGELPTSRYRDPQAYVSNYTLVAHLPPGTPIKFQNVTFPSEGLTLSLKLGYDPLRVTSGVVGGVLKASELFRRMPQMTQAFTLGTICRDDPSYPQVKSYFCRFIDSRADLRPAPDSSCDAISLGMRFGTTIVKAGPLAPEPTFGGCPSERDPATDTCETSASTEGR